MDQRERKWIESGGSERRPVLNAVAALMPASGQSEELVRWQCAGESGETGLLEGSGDVWCEIVATWKPDCDRQQGNRNGPEAIEYLA